jgi:hypothetical protein
VLASDSFAGTNGTALTAHLLDSGQNWEFISGGDVAVLKNGSGYAASDAWYLTNGRHPDAALTMTVQLDDGNAYAIPLVRAASGGNCYAVYLLGGGGLYLYRFMNGGASAVASSSWAPDTNPHTLKVVCNGPSITCYLDGVAKINYSGATFNTRAVQSGFRLSGAAVKNFSVAKV